MKKFLLFSLAAMLSMAMSAQSLRTTTLTGALQRSGMIQSFDSRHKAPARAELGPNQMILGHYDTDDLTTNGLGLTGFPGTIPTGIELSADELEVFRGGKIVAFRVGLAAATPITRVFAAPMSGGAMGEFTEWTCDAGAQGWNVIPVEPAFEISEDGSTGLFIGFDYTQTSSNYPLSAVDAGTICPTYCYLTYQGQTSWFDLGMQDYGNLSLQCIVESDHFPEYAVKMGRLTCSGKYIKAGDPLGYNITVKNGGVATIEPDALVLDVMLDGEKVGEIHNSGAIASSFVNISGSIDTEGMETGKHTVAIVPATLNGEAIENPTTLSYDFFILSNMFPRQKHLLEQFTSNSCTYCPLGTSLIETLQSKRDDIARVAIHGNMNSVDPTNTAQCDTIFAYVGCGGWPYGTFDRMVGWDSDEAIANGLGYNATYHDQIADELGAFFDDIAANMPSFATINIDSEINPLTREAKVVVSGEVTEDFDVMMGEDAKLTVYITEDSIVYRQLNQGRWTSKYRHDGVLREALGSAFGVPLNKDGVNYRNEFTLNLPADWKMDYLNVIAFISRPLKNGATKVYTDMYVNNTEMADMYVLPVTAAPEISFEVTEEEVIISATGEGDVHLYVNGEEVENPFTIARGEEDVTVTVVATAQDGDKLMNTSTIEYVIPAIVEQAVNELFTGKTVASVRYFNMMGQETTTANGATIVVTTYTDGTTTATKVMK